MADSPITGADGPVGIAITCGGSRVPDSIEVVSVHVRRAVDEVPEARVRLRAGSVAEQEFPEVDGARFDLGTEIEIAGLYGGGAGQTVFRGVIVAQRLRIAGDGGAEQELTCRDKAVALAHGARSGLHAEARDSDVMAGILADAGLGADIAASPDTPRDQLRHGMTDWAFLRQLAGRNGHVLTVEGGRVSSRPPDLSAPPVLTLTLGADVLAFDAEADGAGLVAGARGQAWDDAAQTRQEASGAMPTGGTWGNRSFAGLAGTIETPDALFTTEAPPDMARLKAGADGRLLRAALSAIRGSVTFQGSGKAVPGAMIELAGFGDRFSGTAFIGAVEHEIAEGVWTTRAELGLPDTGPEGPKGQAQGVQIAKVIRIHDDPGARLRIKVALPMVGEPPAELWVRWVQPYASSGAGIQFLPEIGDEVVLAFLAGDPNAPVAIGALHNGQAPRGHGADEANGLKAIRTREGLSLAFDDEAKRVTVATPGGHCVTLDDAGQTLSMVDSHGNRVALSADGIRLESKGDLRLTAEGRIEISAGGDASLEGRDVTARAEAQLRAEGGAAADLTSGGTLTVKGSLVQIN